MKAKLLRWLPALALITLAACSGKTDDPTATGIPVATVADYSNYVGSRSDDNAVEPLAVDDLMPPTSETDEPIDVQP